MTAASIIPRHLRGGRSSMGHGLNRRSARPYRRWAVDNVGHEGYAHLLTDAERAWLERFNREYYQADSKALNAPDALHNQEQRRAIFRAQNYAREDMYSRGGMVLGHGDYYRLAEGASQQAVKDVKWSTASHVPGDEP